MSLSIECAECGYTGSVSPAKAGQTIPCPSCDQLIQVPGRKRSGGSSGRDRQRRPSTDKSSTSMIALAGASIMLAGVLLMVWIKKNQLGDDQFFSMETSPTDAVPENSAPPGEAVIISEPPEGTPPSAGNPNPGAAQDTTHADSNQSSVAVVGGDSGNNEAIESGNVILPKISAVPPEMLLMAGMNEVVLQIDGFPADTRGAVENAVTAEVVNQLRKCRLRKVESSDKPSFVVELDLRQDGGVRKLAMKAELRGDVSGVPVSVWKNEAALVPVADKSLTGAVGLPGLDREVSRFFTPLREKLSAARNTIEAIRRNKEHREQQGRTTVPGHRTRVAALP